MDKACAPQDTWWNREEGNPPKNERVWYLILNSRRGHKVNQITSGEHCIPQKMQWNICLYERSACNLSNMPISSLCDLILLSSVRTRLLVKNSMGTHKLFKLRG